MSDLSDDECLYFVSYTGVALPLKLVGLIPPEALSYRNTFFRGYFDKAGTLKGFDKVIYGEVELSHRYEYHGNGALKQVRIDRLDEEPESLTFNEVGARVAHA